MPNIINATYAPVLRTGGAAGTAWHQRDTGLLYVPPTYRHKALGTVAAAGSFYDQREGLVIRNFELHNRSAAASAVGIGGRIANRHWIAGRLSADGATFTDFTSTAQSQSTSTLQVAGADQTGFCILSRVKFDAVSVNITTAETNAGGTTVADHTVAYSTGATWTTLGANAATTDGFTTSDAVWTAAVHNLAMFSPADWAVTASNGGVPDGYYGIRFTSAEREASDVAAVATGMEIFNLLIIEGLADNAVYAAEDVSYELPYVDGIVAYFADDDAGNRVYAEVDAWL